MAWLQINSARDRRGNDPEVLRVMGMIEGAIGKATSLDSYEKLAQKTELTLEGLKARTEIATRFGNEEQFAEGIDALEKAGKAKEAGELRTARKLRQLPWGRRGEEGQAKTEEGAQS